MSGEKTRQETNELLQASDKSQHPLRSDLSQEQRPKTNNSFASSSVKLKWDKVPHTFPCAFMWL